MDVGCFDCFPDCFAEQIREKNLQSSSLFLENIFKPHILKLKKVVLKVSTEVTLFFIINLYLVTSYNDALL